MNLFQLFSVLFSLVSMVNYLTSQGGGGTPLQEANRDVPLDGVAFSIDLLEWDRKFLDFGGKEGFKMGRFSVKKSGSCCLLNLTISSH